MINIRYSTYRFESMIEHCNDIVLEYFDRIKENFLFFFLLPLFLVFLCLYVVYLLLYGILIAVGWIQKGGPIKLISYIESTNILLRILKITLYIIVFPINFVLYIFSTILPIPILILINIFHFIVFLFALPFSL